MVNRRLKIAKELKTLEKKKIIFQNQIDNLNSEEPKFKTISFVTKTEDFKNKGTTEKLTFDSRHLNEYLNAEVSLINRQIEILVENLKKEMI